VGITDKKDSGKDRSRFPSGMTNKKSRADKRWCAVHIFSWLDLGMMQRMLPGRKSRLLDGIIR
jgi:hypothetical protein